MAFSLGPGWIRDREKNFKLGIQTNLNQTRWHDEDVIDQLNVMLKSVTSDPALSDVHCDVHYIDLRTLSTDSKTTHIRNGGPTNCIRRKGI